ncbi:MAG: phosphoribosylformylglycinamidine cyclo-ligase [Eubacteriaceae bacterium]|nr:phosphoribosylformylglycinamidine cyclo-ligase [Eubacteriaceae bacterium]
MDNTKITYKDAGVDKEAGYESVKKIKGMVAETYTPFVLSSLGGFGGTVAIPAGYKEPLLVSGTDGVGTKLIIAQKMDKHDTVGIDLVAMCVNDVLCHGAMPLYFLDYIACGKNEPDKIALIVKGVTEGCKKAGCALIGGETAEMPGMYAVDDYDLAGFATGIVDKEKFITGEKVTEGDVLIGLKSSGVHSNGFSLVRKILFDLKGYDVDSYIEELGMTVGEALIVPTEIYVRDVMAVLEKIDVHGMCHITGGGYIENVPRMIPDGLCADMDVTEVKYNPVFDFIAKEGNIEMMEMFGTFNMGIGFIIAVDPSDVEKTIEILSGFDHDPKVIGKITKGEEKVCLKY